MNEQKNNAREDVSTRDAMADEQEMNQLQDATIEGIQETVDTTVPIDEDFVAAIKAQEEMLKADIPELNLAQEMENEPLFATMLACGENLYDVYSYFHPEFLEKRMEETVMARIQKRNLRPSAMKSRPSSSNVSIENLSEKEIADIDARVRRGEKITF